MRIAPVSTDGIRPAARRRAVARVVSALLLVAGTVVISASPASARPRNCDAMWNTADLYRGYAEAEFGVGDVQEGARWLNAYYGQVQRINNSAC
jgi:hypothetical protein